MPTQEKTDVTLDTCLGSQTKQMRSHALSKLVKPCANDQTQTSSTSIQLNTPIHMKTHPHVRGGAGNLPSGPTPSYASLLRFMYQRQR